MLLSGAAESSEMADTLQLASIVADRGIVVSRTDTIRISNAISITDALKSFPGLYVGDNGGAAGLKAVSLRGMGNAHTSIYIDGVRVGNIQSGQNDLGMLDLENYGMAVIDYAQNSLSFQTKKPDLGGSNFAGALKMRAGSFGTYEPSLKLGFRLSDAVTAAATANGILSKGDFPYGENGGTRANNDISQLRTGLDFWGRMEGGEWHAKAFCNCAERGTPGSTAWPSADRQKDCNTLLQGILNKQFTPLYQLNFSTKLSYDKLLYCSEWGDSDYRQTEIQVNSTHKFSLSDWFDASLTADYQWDGLSSTEYGSSRSAIIATAAASFHPSRFRATAGIEYYGYKDSGEPVHSAVSPSVDLRWNVFEGFDILGFARREYRVPTFNELFYPGYGNPGLKAEDAWLTDAGAEYHHPLTEHWRLSMKADAFLYRLKDKITSAPTAEDPNIWLPFNIGVVHMTGADTETEIKYYKEGTSASFSARYCYQNGIDKTPDSYTYGQQIPFVNKHTLILRAGCSFNGWEPAIDWIWRGGRYDSVGKIPSYHTLDLSFGKEFHLKGRLSTGLKLIARNITDSRYELTAGYPMPGRSFFGEISINF